MKEMSIKETDFVRFITEIGSKTYSNATESAKKAGYAQPCNAGWKIMKRQDIKDAIKQRHQEILDKSNLSIEKTLNDLENLRRKCEEEGKYASAIRAAELQGRYLSMFSDKFVISPEKTPQEVELSEIQKREIKAIAKIRLRQMTHPEEFKDWDED